MCDGRGAPPRQDGRDHGSTRRRRLGVDDGDALTLVTRLVIYRSESAHCASTGPCPSSHTYYSPIHLPVVLVWIPHAESLWIPPIRLAFPLSCSRQVLTDAPRETVAQTGNALRTLSTPTKDAKPTKNPCDEPGAMCIQSEEEGETWISPSLPSEEGETTPPFRAMALMGDSDDISLGICITSPTATATPDGSKIAAQCCTASGTCKRRTANRDAACIAGAFGGSSFVEMTHAQTQSVCSSRGLVMCERSCAGEGCFYNNAYVWTGLPCLS